MRKIFPVNRCNDCPHFETFVKNDEFLHVCRFQNNVELIRHDFDNDIVSIPDWCKLSDMPGPKKSKSSLIERARKLREEITQISKVNPYSRLLADIERFLTELIDD
jgi:hypothetical protein